MCGVAGFALTKKGRQGFPVDLFSKALLVGIQDRGEHATGYVTVAPQNKKPRVEYVKEPVKAEDFIKTHTLDARAQMALLHTRHWTKGDPKDGDNNHPVKWNTCYAVHNGSIKNDDDVLVEAGIDKEKRVGEVDSFAVPVALEYHGWGDEADIKLSLHMLKGPFAIAAVDPSTKPGRVLLAKGENSPLVALLHPSGIFWASSRKAIEDAWGSVLGTPPANTTTLNPNHFGWYHFLAGDYWSCDISTGKLVIRSGKFDVNYGYNHSTNYASQGYGGGAAWRAYTSDDHEWTCWPNEKNCVFQHDCPGCYTDDCECWAGNPNHPAMNEGLKYNELRDKHATFKSHVDRHKLKKELIERPANPHVGVRVIQPNPASRRAPATPLTSEQTESATASRTTSHLALIRASGTLDSAKCYYCESESLVKEMEELNSAVEGIDALYACSSCSKVVGNPKSPIGHDPGIIPLLRNNREEALAAEEIVTQAAQETAWMFKIAPSFVRYVCLYNPHAWKGHDNTDFAKFVAEVRACFLDNAKVVTELRNLDKVND